jgi:hypothetical protein
METEEGESGEAQGEVVCPNCGSVEDMSDVLTNDDGMAVCQACWVPTEPSEWMDAG